MGNVVTPILNGLGFSQLGNTDLSGTVRITEQLLKTAASPADVIAALNDLNKNVESFTSPDQISGLISAAKTLEALAGFFVKLVPGIGIGLSVASLGSNLTKAVIEINKLPERKVSPETQLAITNDFLSIIGGIALIAGTVGVASTAGLLLIPVGAALTVAGVLGDTNDPNYKAFIGHLNSLPFVPDWGKSIKAVVSSYSPADYQYSAHSMTLAAALIKIDANIDSALLNRILDGAASSDDIGVEAIAAFNQLRGLFNPTAAPLATNVSGADFAAAVAAFTPPSTGKVVALGGQSRDSIATLARSNFSYFIALDQLTSFAVIDTTGSAIRTAQQTAYAPDYARWLQDSQLTAEQLAQGKGNYSQLWYDDRAAMLTWKLKGQTDEGAVVGGVQTVRGTIAGVGAQALLFKDLTTQSTILVESAVASTATRRFIFGGAIPEVIEGDQYDDHLFGGAGNDTLDGKASNDYIDGQTGDDLLIGGEGNDTLVGGKDNDTYQFTGSFGNDTITDSDGLGSISINGQILGQASSIIKVSDNVWETQDKKYVLTQAGTRLIIGQRSAVGAGTVTNTITVNDWQDGQLGLTLGATAAPNTKPIYLGDQHAPLKTDDKGQQTYDWSITSWAADGSSEIHSKLSNKRLGRQRIWNKKVLKTGCGRLKAGHLTSKTAYDPSVYSIVCYENKSNSEQRTAHFPRATSYPHNCTAFKLRQHGASA